jgi:hypothetical protein
MEARLESLSRRWMEIGSPERHKFRDEYCALHPKWVKAKAQLAMDV